MIAAIASSRPNLTNAPRSSATWLTSRHGSCGGSRRSWPATDAADELRARLKVEKARKAALTAEMEALKKGRGRVAELDHKRLLQELRARVRYVHSLLGHQDTHPADAADPQEAAGGPPGVPCVRRGRPGGVSLHRAGQL
jgi:hypothetical protein